MEKKRSFFKILLLSFSIFTQIGIIRPSEHSGKNELNQDEFHEDEGFQLVSKRPREKKYHHFNRFTYSIFDLKPPETVTEIDLTAGFKNFSDLYKKNVLVEICNSAINLETLLLGSNDLDTLPFCIGNLCNLQTLNVSDNNLTFLPFSLKKLTSLSFIDVSQNHFFYFPKVIFCLQTLENLNISNNSLSELPPCFKRNLALKTLNLSSNSLVSFPPSWKNLEQLSSLNLSHNRFRKIPPILKKIQRRKKSPLYINFFNKSMGKIPKVCKGDSLFKNQGIITCLEFPSYSHDLLLQGIYYAHQHCHLTGENIHILLIESDVSKKFSPIHISLRNNLRPQASSILPIHAQKVAQIIVSKQDQDLRIPIAPGAILGFLNCSLSDCQMSKNIKSFQDNVGGFLINMSYRSPSYPLELLNFPGLIIKTLGNDKIPFNQADPEFYRLMKSSAEFCSHVILVGALDYSGYQLASYTNTPGGDDFIYSRTLFATGGDLAYTSSIPFKVCESDGLTYGDGTSFAAPLVTGALALLQEKLKEEIYSKKITFVDLGNVLLDSADVFGICDSTGLLTTSKKTIGRGRLDLKRALKRAKRLFSCRQPYLL